MSTTLDEVRRGHAYGYGWLSGAAKAAIARLEDEDVAGALQALRQGLEWERNRTQGDAR